MDSKPIQLAADYALDDTIGYRHGQPLSLRDLCQRTYLWENRLKQLPGLKLALFIEDTLEFIAALIAGLRANKTFYLPANALEATARSLTKYVDGFIGQFPEAFSPVSLPLAADDNTAPTAPLTVDGNRELFIFTSGSTGEPQAIPKRIEQLTTEVSILESTFGRNLKDIPLYATVSHNHIYGLLFKVFWPLCTRHPIHSESLNWPEELVAAAGKEDIVLVSSPAHLKRFAQSDVFDALKRKIPATFSSGAPLDRETALTIASLFGNAPYEVYGSSETGGIAWRQRHENTTDSWTPLDGVLWQINKADSTLEVKSPHLYDKNWFQMADIVSPEGENRFLLKGRVDRIVKLEEKRISLSAIERELLSSGFVTNCRIIVVDMPDTKRQRFAAIIILNDHGRRFLRDNGQPALNRLFREKLSTVFEPVTLPKIWRYINEMPVNKQGKTTYADLQALLG